MTLPDRLRELGSLPKCSHEEQIFLNASADEIEHLKACLAEIRVYGETGLGLGLTKSAILRAVEAGIGAKNV